MPTPSMGPPRAPTKSRSIPTTTTTRSTRTTTRTNLTTSPTRTTKQQVEQLSDNLTELSLKSTTTKKRVPSSKLPLQPPSKPLQSTTTSRVTQQQLPSRTNPKVRQPEPDETLTDGQRAKQCTNTINASLSILATLVQNGFKAESNTSSAPPSSAATTTTATRPGSLSRASSSSRTTSTSRTNPSSSSSSHSSSRDREKGLQAARDASKAFETLRKLGRENVQLGNKRLAVERTAGKLVADLVQLELYRPALEELSAMRHSILSWFLPSPISAAPQPSLAPNSTPSRLVSYISNLPIPLPPSTYFTSPPTLSETLSKSPTRQTIEEIVPLVLAVQQYTLLSLYRCKEVEDDVEMRRERAERIERVLVGAGGREEGREEEGGPLAWIRLWRIHRDRGEGVGERPTKEEELVGLEKRIDGILLSMFQTITQGSTSTEGIVAPEILLNLRTQALLYYASVSTFTTSPSSTKTTITSSKPPPSQLPAFHAQHRKILLRFGRSAQTLPYSYSSRQISDYVKRTFETLMEKLEERRLVKKDGQQGGGGEEEKEWRELCQVVLHIANKGEDSDLVSIVSSYLDNNSDSMTTTTTTSSPDSNPSSRPVASASSQASQIITSLLRLLTLFDLFTKSLKSPSTTKPEIDMETLLEALRRAPSYVERAHRLRSQADSSSPSSPSSSSTTALSNETLNELDKVVHQIRHVFVRFVRTPRDNSASPIDGTTDLLRSDQLITPAGRTKPIPTDSNLIEIDNFVRETLNAFVSTVERRHVDRASSSGGGGIRSDRDVALRINAVDVLVLLAQDGLSISDRSTHSISFTYLSRTIPLLRRHDDFPSSETTTTHLDIEELSYSIHSVASTFYNIAGRLYTAEKPEACIRFVEKSCELTKEALKRFEEEAKREDDGLVGAVEELNLGEGNVAKSDRRVKKEEEKEIVRKELVKVVARRWELLGLAQHAIGDKRLAYDAYLEAILSQPPDLVSSLETDSATRSFSSNVVKYGPLVKLIDRAVRIATFDLLLPPVQISLAHAFSTSSKRLSLDLKGVLLEFELHALDQTLEHPSSQRAATAVLHSLQEVYSSNERRIRRARILVRCMRRLCVGNELAQDLKPAALSAEIDELCHSSVLGLDGALQSFSAQYVSLSHLYLAFHTYHSQPASTTSASLIEIEARQSLSILRKALDGELPSSPSGPAAATSKVTFQASPARSPIGAIATSPPSVLPPRRRPTRAAATPAKARTAYKTPQTSRTMASGRRTIGTAAKVEQVTPPKKSELDPPREVKVTPAKLGGDASKANLDGPENVYDLLETLSNLLGALGFTLLEMAFLKFLRRLSAKLTRDSDTAFVATSSRLAHAYIVLGKTSRAGVVLAQADQRLQNASTSASPVPVEIEFAHSLRYAEYFAVLGNHDRASRNYDKAVSLTGQIAQADQSASPTAKIIEMTLSLQRIADASSVCSVLLQRRGDLARSLSPALQAMRLGLRALNNVSRLKPTSRPTTDGAATFQAAPTDHVTPLNDLPASSRRKNGVSAGLSQAGLSWHLAEQLAASILRVSNLYFVRGTPKHAEFYASQAIDLAQDLGSLRLTARGLAVRGEVRILAGKWAEADLDLQNVDAIVGKSTCPEAVEGRRLRADLQMRQSLQQEAYLLYLDAQKALDSFVRNAAEAEASQTPMKRSVSAKHLSPVQARSAPKTHSPSDAFSPSPNNRGGNPADWILPASHAYIIRMQVALLRLQKKTGESQALLKRLSKLATLEEDKADELRLLATIQLQDMLARCTSDPVLGMLPDSVLSIPAMGSSMSSAVVRIGTPRTGPTLLNSLKEIETLLVQAMAYSASRSQPAKLRELSLLQGTLRAFHASVGKSSKRNAVSVAHVLDLGLAVTLRREMLDAVDHKLADSARREDLICPLLDTVPQSEGTEEDDLPTDEQRLLIALRDRYRHETAEPSLTEPSISSILPPNCSTISIHLTPDRESLLLVRHRRDCDPIVFKLPLDRLARREGEDESFTFDDAIGELEDIIASSNTSSQNAKHVNSRDARAEWWQQRQELDERLKDLLQTIEDHWLGAFKSVFYDARYHSTEAFANFKNRIERVLKRSIVRAAQDKKSTRFKLDDAIVECIAALPASSREEDLEDLFFFMTEAFQLGGVPLASDETDVDQVVVDLREALEELHGTKSAPKGTPHLDEHTFLILDKALRSFPWESLPCLIGRSVSRLPSLSFLRDRLELAASRCTDESASTTISVDPHRCAFVLNPGGDLKATQKTFEPWLEKQSVEAGWTGIIGRTPQEEELRASLINKDLVLYFGHGGAEQYIRTQTIRHLPRCAVTMLWGCSSGSLKDQGDFDPVGTPYNYMVAGCPALVANLWDVTDKDIDKFAQSVFDQTGISSPSSDSLPPVTLTSAVAKSRSVCNLRYLNGAAPVVYGVPVRFLASS